MLSKVDLDAMQENRRATRGFSGRKAVCEHKHKEMEIREWMMEIREWMMDKTVPILAAPITLDCCNADFE